MAGRSGSTSDRIMRVAYLVTDLGLGGTQEFVELAATALVRRGHEVMILVDRAPLDRAERLIARGVSVRHYARRQSVAQHARTLRSAGTDVVHLCIWDRPSELLRLGRTAGIPLALSYQHVPKWSRRVLLERLRRPRLGASFAKRWLYSLRYVDAHIGCCAASAEGIRRELGPAMRRRVHELSNAVLVPNERVAPEMLAGSPKFLQVGALNPRKRPDLTLGAFASLRREFPDATLTLVGDGPMRGQLERRVEAEHIGGVRFVGSVANPSHFYLEANVLLLPSMEEGLPYTLLEGAARGLPLIASDVDGNPELVVEGCTGLLTRPGDEDSLRGAMRALAASPDLRLQRGENGRAVVAQRFGLADHVQKLIAIYESMLR
jgi:glycosyltransferase involved in cell wall biosynthesis